MRKIALLLAPLALPFAPAIKAKAESPSFACSAAGTEVERTICATPELASEDSVMARLYAAARRGARGDGQSGQGAAQLAWLRERAGCEAFNRQAYASRAECLAERYRERNIELATATLFTERNEALATLRRLDPKGAPLLEALTIYAARPESSDWSSITLRQERDQIKALLVPQFRMLGGDPAQGYGSDILSDDGIASMDDALKSPINFTRTIKILATYAESSRTPLLFPCEVLVRHPAMIELEQPIFGSSLDNFVPDSDCGVSLPASPHLAALSTAIWESWPECQGTIRYWAYRNYGARFDAAWLGQPSAPAFSKRPMPHLKGVSPRVVAAAQQELITSYVTVNGQSSGIARAAARERLVDLLSAAHECDG